MIPRAMANYSLGDFISATLAGLRTDGRPDFSARLKQATGAEHVVLAPSARAGLKLLFKAIDRPRVVCPAYTCGAVIAAIRLAGKAVDFVPLAPSGFNADIEAIAERSGPDCAILMTHQFGQLADIDAYRQTAAASGALLIEDAAAAQGGDWKGSHGGTHGAASVISFANAKVLPRALHAGAILCSDPALGVALEKQAQAEFGSAGSLTGLRNWLAAGIYATLRSRSLYALFHFVNFRLRNRYSAEKPLGESVSGSHFRGLMQPWQAHLLLRQMDTLEANVHRRRDVFERYRRTLERLPVRRLPDPAAPGDACARFAFVPEDDRIGIVKAGWAGGIDLGTAFSCIEAPAEFSEEHSIANAIVNLPLYPQLTEDEISRILDFLERMLGKGGD